MALSFRAALAVLAFATAVGCAHSPSSSNPGPASLPGTDGVTRTFPEMVRGAPATVVVFFSATCPCVEAHDARLRSLAERVTAAGGQLYAVDSEFGSTLEADRSEAQRRGYPFPILLDPGARLATAVGAEYADYTAVFDASGALRYSGGFDSSRQQEGPDTQPWARRALDAVLAGRPVDTVHSKALGCALRRW